MRCWTGAGPHSPDRSIIRGLTEIWMERYDAVGAAARRKLQQAQTETEKLAAAADTYKRDLLRQRAADAEQELADAKDRL